MLKKKKLGGKGGLLAPGIKTGGKHLSMADYNCDQSNRVNNKNYGKWVH